METNCTCCGKFLVWKYGEKWDCWYCDRENTGAWRCAKHTPPPPEGKLVDADGATGLRYFDGTYVFEGKATVTQIIEVENGKVDVMLDQTIFHPQGGGQPSDVGTITSLEGQIFNVTAVQMKDRKTVIHSGQFEGGGSKFTVGTSVKLSIDRKTRETAARAHSAGHLIDLAVEKAGFKFVPTKGYHFPDGPYVEYEGDIPAEQREEALKNIQQALDVLLATPGGLPVTAQVVPYDDITRLCGSTPSYMPVGKPARVVSFAGSLGCPCGGTHVENSKEIGTCRVTKLVKRKNILRVCYEVK